MYKRHFYTAVILLSFMTIGIQPTNAEIYIPADQSVGTWDETNQIYTLTSDVSDTIILSNPLWDGTTNPETEEQRIIFEGGGHTISSPTSYGISFNQDDISKNGYITIQNLNITDCDDNGIDIRYATRINVNNVNISSIGNYGIWIGNAGTCIIRDNTISDCDERAIYLSGAINNTIYNNNFLNRAGKQAYVTGGSGNVFNLDPPIGGNYWSDYTGVDSDGDGFGDIWYTFVGGEDKLPLVPSAETKLEELIEKVESYNGELGISNALDAKLQNALDALTAKNAGQRQDAINKMEAFINAVEAQSGNKIPVEIADELIADARYIIDLILAE